MVTKDNITICATRKEARRIMNCDTCFEGEGAGYYQIKRKTDDHGEYILLAKIKNNTKGAKWIIQNEPCLLILEEQRPETPNWMQTGNKI